jgi:hypothetical protein
VEGGVALVLDKLIKLDPKQRPRRVKATLNFIAATGTTSLPISLLALFRGQYMMTIRS